MTIKRLDLSMTLDGRIEPVEVSIYPGENFNTFARIEGGSFFQFDINLLDLEQTILILQQVLQQVSRGDYARST